MTATSALTADAASLGLRRLVVDTALGPVLVRTGRSAGGPATLLLHGAAGSWTTWTPMIAESDRRGAPLTDLVLVDLPGWGESEAPEHAPSVPAMSAVVGEVAEALGYRSWTVIGHSLGGFVALDLAARRPEATLAVGLISGTGPAVLDAIRRPLRGGVGLPAFAGMLLAMRVLAALGPAVPRLLRTANRFGILRLLGGPLFADLRAVDRTVIDGFAAEIRPAAFVRAARTAGGYDERIWARICCPVRSVRGGRDVFVGAGDTAAFAERIADFRETRLPAAGHFAAIERPGDVLDLLLPVLHPAAAAPAPTGVAELTDERRPQVGSARGRVIRPVVRAARRERGVQAPAH